MESKNEDSDYYDSEIGDEEGEDQTKDAHKYYIGENGLPAEDPKGRGRRKGAGSATNILKSVRKR